MSAITDRLERGLAALAAGDTERAEAILHEVSADPDAPRAPAWLAPQAEASYRALATGLERSRRGDAPPPGDALIARASAPGAIEAAPSGQRAVAMRAEVTLTAAPATDGDAPPVAEGPRVLEGHAAVEVAGSSEVHETRDGEVTQRSQLDDAQRRRVRTARVREDDHTETFVSDAVERQVERYTYTERDAAGVVREVRCERERAVIERVRETVVTREALPAAPAGALQVEAQASALREVNGEREVLGDVALGRRLHDPAEARRWARGPELERDDARRWARGPALEADDTDWSRGPDLDVEEDED